MKLVGSMLVAALAVAACKGGTKDNATAGSSAPAGSGSATTSGSGSATGSGSAAAAAGSAAVQFAAGEQLALTGATDISPVETWTANGVTWTLAAIQRGDNVLVRAFGDHTALDVTDEIPVGELGVDFVKTGRGVVFHTADRLGASPEGVPLKRIDYRLITFTDGAPKVTETFSCKETKAVSNCPDPAWIQ